MTTSGLTIKGAMEPGFETVLTPGALAFVESLVRTFTGRVDELLAARRTRAKGFETAAGWDFLPETAGVRAGDWKVAPLPADLLDRRVEITGPVERKMIINALNSGANVFMADFEDANSPTWSNQVSGQVNLMDAVRRRIEFNDPKTGKQYRLNPAPAVLFVRPRGWHLRERHVTVDGRDIPGGLFDFGLFFFHNAQEQLARGTGPYFYLPKMEHHLEARLWNDVFVFAQDVLGVPRGSVKATVLIETLPAAFQMDEILYELREHSAGLNCGRWDYIFSFIKKRAADPTSLLPDRGQVTMDKGFLKAYAQLLIRTCHRRGVHAMGGMAAQIPIKDDPAANEAALARVRADKLREVRDGHDGTWVAHPGLVAVAREIFDAHMPTPNQIDRLRDDVHVTREDLLVPHTGTRSEAGLRHNVRVGIQYIESWLRGNGCVPLYNLMEDAATAEIARAQVWQWVRYGVALDDGSVVTAERLHAVIDEEMARIAAEQGAARMERGRFAEARKLFEALSTAPTFEEFLTLPAYEMLG
ncbi:MAG: malate synthase A [Deltaproteobacteria bacterium]|nr:malate synthase A [Myxococcales bacterium]MDP3214246.1 malate synthase A [Deltaproteobacteria bacterium]